MNHFSLLAELYIVLRLGYITSHMEFVFAQLVATLTAAAGQDVAPMSDELIRVRFQKTQSTGGEIKPGRSFVVGDDAPEQITPGIFQPKEK